MIPVMLAIKMALLPFYILGLMGIGAAFVIDVLVYLIKGGKDNE